MVQVEDPLKNGEINEGFVTMWDSANYKNLGQVLIQSVLHFSKYPIVVMLQEGTPSLDPEYLGNSRIILKNMTKCDGHSYFCKMQAILQSGIRHGVWADTDAVVINRRVDQLFDMIKKHKKPFPLMPRHPGPDPQNEGPCMDQLHVKSKSMPYVHAAVVIFNPESRGFIEEVWNARHICAHNNWDETALNVMMWKNNVTEFACFLEPYFDHFEQFRVTSAPHERRAETTPCLFRFSHGSKSPNTNMNIFNQAKQLPEDQPDILHGTEFFSSEVRSCCPDGSFPSGIHPTLCKM